jgi:alpha-tubulin suppressor-like RCC1 family protein
MRVASILIVTWISLLFGIGSLATAQDWGRILENTAKRRANRAAQEAIDKGLDAAEDAVRCVVTDQACIDRAGQSGQDVVLTNNKGKPLPPERQVASGTNAGAGADASGESNVSAAAIASPVGLNEIRVAASTAHTLVIAPDGTVFAQGRNDSSQSSGDGRKDSVATLTTVANAPRAVDASTCGIWCSLLAGADGRVYVWGRHDFGVLGGDGRNNIGELDRPTPLPGIRNVVDVEGCNRAAAALRSDGTVWMWGEDQGGVMGTGKLTGEYESGEEYHRPVRVKGIDEVTQIACGREHMLVLRRDGTVWTWGANKDGQLGVGDTEPRGRPPQVVGLAGVTRVRASGFGSMARLEDGSWRVWGFVGPPMKPGPVPPTVVPTALPSVLAGTVDIDGDIAALADGTVRTWGDNTFGFLGTGQGVDVEVHQPVKVRGLSGIVRVWSGGSRAHALAADGTLYYWGPTGGSGSPNRVPVVLGRLPVAAGGQSP